MDERADERTKSDLELHELVERPVSLGAFVVVSVSGPRSKAASGNSGSSRLVPMSIYLWTRPAGISAITSA